MTSTDSARRSMVYRLMVGEPSDRLCYVVGNAVLGKCGVVLAWEVSKSMKPKGPRRFSLFVND